MIDDGAWPLAGVRVLDATDSRLDMGGRYLADLGADVVRVEPPGGCPSRRAEPTVAGHGLRFLVGNANKRGIVVDLHDPSGRRDFRDRVRSADILLESAAPGAWNEIELGPDALAAVNPALVQVSLTEFGRTGPARNQ